MEVYVYVCVFLCQEYLSIDQFIIVMYLYFFF